MDKIAITEKDKVHEQWYIDAKVQTAESLPEFIRHLTEDYSHDYGTIVHACAAAAIAATWTVDHACGGISGFQAGAVMWEYIVEWQGLRNKPLRLMQYSDMLYPQYKDKFQKTISKDTWKWLQDEAAKNLAEKESDYTSTTVYQHWQNIVAGIIPFGYTVKDD